MLTVHHPTDNPHSMEYESKVEQCVLANILCRIESEGYALIHQRQTVVAGLLAYGDILDVEEFWMFMRNRNQCISLASVHSCLNLLSHIGILEKVCAGRRRVTYLLSAE